jgi:hypothetical protein
MNRALAVIVLVLVGVLIFGVYSACGPAGSTPLQLACVRDIAIIILVLETFVVTLLLALIVVLFGWLVTTVQDEIKPILMSAQQTVNTVQGTTRFVADTVVSPIISLAGMGAGVRSTLLALLSRRKGKEE